MYKPNANELVRFAEVQPIYPKQAALKKGSSMEMETAAIEKRYEREISMAEGNKFKTKRLEQQKQKEAAKVKDEAFVTVNTVTGDKGIKQAQDEYQRLMNNKSPKSKRK